MLGVLPAYRDHKLGERLKWAQRAHALSRGIDESPGLTTRWRRATPASICTSWARSAIPILKTSTAIWMAIMPACLPTASRSIGGCAARVWSSGRNRPRKQALHSYKAEGSVVLNLPQTGHFFRPDVGALPEAEAVLLAVPADIQAVEAAGYGAGIGVAAAYAGLVPAAFRRWLSGAGPGFGS
jgi:hypothetical protein